jgi:hypothetical protein
VVVTARAPLPGNDAHGQAPLRHSTEAAGGAASSGTNKAQSAPISGAKGTTDMPDDPNCGRAKEVAVIVTTAHRGIFFGYTTDVAGRTISLRAARNCVDWPASSNSFLGLASKGPIKGAMVSPAADIVLHDVICVAQCTDAAVEAWESRPWRW